jgi:hypothetical protein
MMTTLTLTSRLLLGAAMSVALLGGCNKRPADQPTPSVTNPEPATPATTPPANTTPPATTPDNTTPPATPGTPPPPAQNPPPATNQ